MASCTKCWLMSQSLGISEFLCIQCVPTSVSGRMSSSMDSDVCVWMHELMSTDDITFSSSVRLRKPETKTCCFVVLSVHVHDSFLHVNIPTALVETAPFSTGCKKFLPNAGFWHLLGQNVVLVLIQMYVRV